MDDYVYHITKKRVAFDFIKMQGLIPASNSSGAAVARREGAFASDSNENLEKKVPSKLTVPISTALKNGYTREQIENKNYMFTSVPLNGSLARNEAYEFLSDFEKRFYSQHFPKLAGKASSMSFAQLKKMSSGLAQEIYSRNRQHDLCRLARELVHLEHAIEERETASHIYFFEAKNASTCYPDYTKHHGGAIYCRVLRVKRNKINHLEQDMAEGRGVMTRESVLPQFIEIYNTENSPFSSSAGENWLPLTEAAES